MERAGEGEGEAACVRMEFFQMTAEPMLCSW
jgi:hypothetical protein